MIMAIDPGKNGGVAMAFDSGKLISFPIPQDRVSFIEEVDNSIDSYCGESEIVCSYVEKVHSMPVQGVKSTFSFGQQFERACMVCVHCGISLDDNITPQKWQRGLGLRKKLKTESSNKYKDYLLGQSMQLFPDQFKGIKTKDEKLKIADALLILEYVSRIKSI